MGEFAEGACLPGVDLKMGWEFSEGVEFVESARLVSM